MSDSYDPYDTRAKASIIGPTVSFKGELTAEEDLLIQGKVQGSISHTARLTVGKQGTVKAEVRAKHVEIDGEVEGDVYGVDSVNVRAAANVKGNIFSPTVTLVEGAHFKGSIDMDPRKARQEQPTKTSQAAEPAPALRSKAAAAR